MDLLPLSSQALDQGTVFCKLLCGVFDSSS